MQQDGGNNGYQQGNGGSSYNRPNQNQNDNDVISNDVPDDLPF
jgi:hypothetical protein